MNNGSTEMLCSNDLGLTEVSPGSDPPVSRAEAVPRAGGEKCVEGQTLPSRARKDAPRAGGEKCVEGQTLPSRAQGKRDACIICVFPITVWIFMFI